MTSEVTNPTTQIYISLYTAFISKLHLNSAIHIFFNSVAMTKCHDAAYCDVDVNGRQRVLADKHSNDKNI